MTSPLVSVICLCYNHEDYIEEAIQSVLNQTYDNVQLIVVDDASEDSSLQRIHAKLEGHESSIVISIEENVGNCKAFNKGLEVAKGDFIIDLAGDDVLLPARIEHGLFDFRRMGDAYGVNYCNANLLDEEGKQIGTHFECDNHGNTKMLIPHGNIYIELLAKYIVCAPTMMIRRSVFDYLGGYDEQLVYEDFDFWVRSSRKYLYCYTNEILVSKRILENSHSASQYSAGSDFLESTLLVCQKAKKLNKTDEENLALRKRTTYELRQSILAKQFEVAAKFLLLLKELGSRGYVYALLIKLRISLSFLR